MRYRDWKKNDLLPVKIFNFLKKNVLISIFTLTFLIRLVAIFVFADLDNPQMWEFGEIARNILSGTGYQYTAFTVSVPSAHMPPGLPYLYFAFFLAFGDGGAAYFLILLFNTILAGFTSVLIYKLADRIYNSKSVALISALYITLSPIYIFSTINFNSIIIYHLLIGLLFYYFIPIYRDVQTAKNNTSGNFYLKYKSTFIFAVILGLFLYFRSEMLAFLFVIIGVLLLKRKFLNAGIMFILPLFMILPWTIRNYGTFGEFIPITTSMGINFYTGHSDAEADREFNKIIKGVKEDSAFETTISRIGFERAFNYIRNNPLLEIKESFVKIYGLWIIDKYRDLAKNPVYVITWLVTLLFFIFGYYRSMKNPVIKDSLLFLNIYLIFSTLLVIIFFNIPRYQVQMSYAIIPAACYGFYLCCTNILEMLRRNKN